MISLPFHEETLVRDVACFGARQDRWLVCLRLGFCPFSGCGDILWRRFTFAIMWFICKERMIGFSRGVRMEFTYLLSHIGD